MDAANAAATMGIPEAQWMKLIHSPSWVSVFSKTGKTQYLKHEVPCCSKIATCLILTLILMLWPIKFDVLFVVRKSLSRYKMCVLYLNMCINCCLIYVNCLLYNLRMINANFRYSSERISVFCINIGYWC